MSGRSISGKSIEATFPGKVQFAPWKPQILPPSSFGSITDEDSDIEADGNNNSMVNVEEFLMERMSKDLPPADLEDPFCWHAYNYAKVSFKIVGASLSGMSIDPKSVSIYPAVKTPVESSAQVTSGDYILWNTLAWMPTLSCVSYRMIYDPKQQPEPNAVYPPSRNECKCLAKKASRRMVEIIWCPKMVDGAWFPRVQPQPRLPLAAPVKKTNGTWMEAPTPSFQVVTTKSMLVPSMIHSLDVSSQDQQKWRQRPQMVQPLFLLQGHPLLNLLCIPSFSPFIYIHHHYPCVEVTWVSSLKRL